MNSASTLTLSHSLPAGRRTHDQPSTSAAAAPSSISPNAPTKPRLQLARSDNMKRRALLRFSTANDDFQVDAYNKRATFSPVKLPSSLPAVVTPTPPEGIDHRPSLWSAVSAPEPVDYFNCKQQTYFPSPAVTPFELDSQCYQTSSYFSPLVTPAAEETLTRPSSPTLSAFYCNRLAPTPEEGPFPYVSYESSFDASGAPNKLLLPTYVPIRTRSRRYSSTRSLPKHLDIKVYFRCSDELVKIRVDPKLSLSDVIRIIARRMPTGWESLFQAKEGVEVGDIAAMDRSNLKRFVINDDWERWVDKSVAIRARRLVLWAI